jgi:hypothetical protein
LRGGDTAGELVEEVALLYVPLRHPVIAAEIFAAWGRVLRLQSLAYECPALSQIVARSAHLEVVDVDNQEELEGGVPEARSPLRNRDETDGLELALTMPFPVSPTIGVPVQRKYERAYWVLHPSPGGGPTVLWQANPGGITA